MTIFSILVCVLLLLLLTSQHLHTGKPSSILSVGLGLVRGRKLILSPEVEGCVLTNCILYDMFVMLFAPHLRCFWLNLYSPDSLGSFW